MAGFQKFPVPKALLTRAYWPYAPRWKANAISIGIGIVLCSFTFYRYTLIRTVIFYNISEYQPWHG